MIDEVIEGLPLHFQRENNIKIYRTLKPVISYIDELIENLKSQTSLLKCSGIFLDFMGERYEEKRNLREDEEYRQALIIKKLALEGFPNTEFLLKITRELTKNEVTEIETRYKNEVASQLFRLNMIDKIKNVNLMPDLNKICEAGAKMYWDLEIINNSSEIRSFSLIENIKKIEITADFNLNQTMKITSESNMNNSIGFTKIIEIRG